MIKYYMRGFTLVELIGVLAIIAVLSALVAPAMIRTFDDVSVDAERKDLHEMALGLEDYIVKWRRIPSDAANAAQNIPGIGALIAGGPARAAANPASWAFALSLESKVPLNKIIQNKKNRTIGYYIDPAFIAWVNNPTTWRAAGQAALATNVQDANGTDLAYFQPAEPPITAPPTLRIMIISDLRTPTSGGLAISNTLNLGNTLGSANGLPANLNANLVPGPGTEFDLVWNQLVNEGATQAAGSILPNDRDDNLLNDPDEGLIIERISLGYLFHRVSMINAHNNGPSGGDRPLFQLENQAIQNLPSPVEAGLQSNITYQVMHNTRLSLYPLFLPPFPNNVSGAPGSAAVQPPLLPPPAAPGTRLTAGLIQIVTSSISLSHSGTQMLTPTTVGPAPGFVVTPATFAFNWVLR